MSFMNSVDVAIVIVILVSGALGIYWGVLRQVLAIGGVLAGAVTAGRYSHAVADSLMSFIADAGLARALGFSLIFVLVSGTVSLVASLMHRYAGLLFLESADHVVGGLLGALQGALICVTFVLAAAAFPHMAWSPALDASRFAGLLASVAAEPILSLLPESFRFAAQTMLGLP